jgi:hypothetical protein
MQREGDRSEITGVTWKSLATSSTFAGLRIHTLLRRARNPSSMKKPFLLILVLLFSISATSLFSQQAPNDQTQPLDQSTPTYKPKFPGDPAHSDSEAAALAYMRVVIRAQKQFNKQYGHYATTLAELVHSGSFTKRMVDPNRGDYTASFKGKKDSYVLTMTPNHMDADHRSFYAEDDGKIHGDSDKPADDKSPLVK